MTQITICVPTYNASKYLKRALDSICEQDFQDFKVIVVDDASKDETRSIVEEFCKKDARFDLRAHSENSGAMGLAVQEMLRECETEYFMWFGADDILTAHYISKLIYLIESTQSDYAYSDFQVIDENDAHTHIWEFPLIELTAYVNQVLTRCSGALPMNGVFKVSSIRARNLDWILYKGESRSSDTINGLYFRSQGLRVSRCSEPLFKYRVHSTNLSHDMSGRLRSDRNVIDFIFEAFPELVEYFAQTQRMTRDAFYTAVNARCDALFLRRCNHHQVPPATADSPKNANK